MKDGKVNMTHKILRKKLNKHTFDVDRWEIFCKCLKLFCILATIFTTAYWVHQYCLDEDICTVDYKRYTDKLSIGETFPVSSMCFENPFKNDTLLETKYNVNRSLLIKYFSGEYFEPFLTDISYDEVTISLNDYIVKYWVEWRNGTTDTYPPIPKNLLKTPFVTYNGFWRNQFYKCYGIEIIHNQINILSFLVKNDIFHEGIRPIYYGFFILFHYPDQLRRSLSGIKYRWPQSRNDSNSVDYEMKFVITDVEVLRRRNKNSYKCNEMWRIYDNYLLSEHLRNIHCKAPYHDGMLIGNFTKCTNRDNIRSANLPLVYDIQQPPPCISMEKALYIYSETDLAGSDWSGGGHFWFSIQFVSQFKVTKSSR